MSGYSYGVPPPYGGYSIPAPSVPGYSQPISIPQPYLPQPSYVVPEVSSSYTSIPPPPQPGYPVPPVLPTRMDPSPVLPPRMDPPVLPPPIFSPTVTSQPATENITETYLHCIVFILVGLAS